MSVFNSKRARQNPWLAKLLETQASQSGGCRLGQQDGAYRLGANFGAASKFDVSWPFLRELHALGRADAAAWLDQNFDAIGVNGTLDMDEALKRSPPKDKPAARG